MDRLYSKQHIRDALDLAPSAPDEDMQWLAAAPPDVAARVRATLTTRRTPAAVLVPLVERDSGMMVLLTQRATTLKEHAGQVSFPGGRIEPEDADAWHAALREAFEEIGLRPELVEFAGYLPDHIVMSGFRVTPVVGFVQPDYQLQIAAAEVHDAFEVPLDYWMPPITSRASARSANSPSTSMTFLTANATSGVQPPGC